ASWRALLKLASDPCDVASLGVNGFGSFCRNKRASSFGGETPAKRREDGSPITNVGDDGGEPAEKY
ncbi:MAG: hypothetical protein V3U07_07130, partial [Nitrospirales bacterium]